MDDLASRSPEIPPTHLGVFKATALIVGAVLVITLLAAAMPARIKLLGLFPVGFAALVGYVFGRIAMLAGLQRRGVLVPLTALVILAGLAGYYGESFRRWRHDREVFYADHIGKQPGGKQILHRVQRNNLSSDPLLRQVDEQYRSLLQPAFDEYVDQRVASLQVAGRKISVNRPWPMILFAGEMFVGTAAGVLASVVASRRNTMTVNKVTA